MAVIDTLNNGVIRSTLIDGVQYRFSNAEYKYWNEHGGSLTLDMNNLKTAGVYELYGERIKADDRLPINNRGNYYDDGTFGGHSFRAKLTVLDASLQKHDGSPATEISITQILMLANRQGGDGNIYIRTYNENNSPFADGWTEWKKMMTSVEGYVYTDTKKLNPDNGVQTRNVGLNYLVDNGHYTGIYVNEEAIQHGTLDSAGNAVGSFNQNIGQIQYIETFNITTINDYAATGVVNNLLKALGLPEKERQIVQFKYATDLLSGTSSFKKRVYKGNDADYSNASKWTPWVDFGGATVDGTNLIMA